MRPEFRGVLPLTRRGMEEVICHRGGSAVTVGRFLAEAVALAEALPDRGGPVVNACVDRYLALLGFAAALLRGHVTLLGAAGRGTPGFWAMVAQLHADAYALTDAPLEGAPLPVVRLDRLPPAAGMPDAVPAIPAERVVAVAYTSGSTGAPAAHPKPWGALVAGAEAAAERFGFRAGDGAPAAIVATVPPQHMYGFETTMMLPLHAAVSVHAGESFFPSDVVAALEEVPARRVLVTTPLHLRALLAEGRRMPPLAAVISATAPLSQEMAEAVERAWQAPMLEIYGATEAGSMASRRSLREEAWTPYRDVEVRSGVAVVPGIGEVPLADAVEPDGQGRFRLLGRLADVVKLAGKRASLAELNRVLAEVEGVVDGAFLAPEDIEANPAARLAAFVVAPGRSAEEILAALRGRIDAVFLPRPVVMVPALPRDALGKLPRGALRALLRDAAPGVARAGRGDDITTRFTVPPDHPAMPGHFPGRPIVPGVLLLDAALRAMREAGAGQAVLLRQAKFVAPVLPGAHVEITLSRRDEGTDRVAFTCRVGEAVVAFGEAGCATPPPRPA